MLNDPFLLRNFRANLSVLWYLLARMIFQFSSSSIVSLFSSSSIALQSLNTALLKEECLLMLTLHLICNQDFVTLDIFCARWPTILHKFCSRYFFVILSILSKEQEDKISSYLLLLK